MRSFATVFASLALLAAPIFAAPSPSVERFSGKVKQGSYIVKLKNGASKTAVTQKLGSAVTHDWDAKFLNGFAGKFSADQVTSLLSNPNVESVSEDGIMQTTATQTNAPWGLQRISQRAKLTNQNDAALTFTYTYFSDGAGVDAYVLDTGINTAHVEFEGRARWGATFGGYANADGNGHGTHCAGTIGGKTYGVAKKVSLIAVKILSDGGSGAVSDIVSGINWVVSQSRSSGRPSIISMSLGGGASTALDSAVASATGAGVHVVVAAGNSNTDAGSSSPARAPSAVTVGASTIADARSSFSNYGSIVDIFAPGSNIISTWIGSTTATNKISGTSMATPHVAGLVAYFISLEGNTSPAAMTTKLQTYCTRNALSGLPSGTINCLAYNNSGL